MKKVTSQTGDAIDFLVRGVRHEPNAVEYHIDEKGVTMRDEDAKVVAERLGSQVKVEDIDVKEAKKEAEAALKDADKDEAPKKEAAKKTAKKEDN